MDGWEPTEARLALLVDADRESRSLLQPLLRARGLDLVHARTGVAGLELLQRMPGRFRLVVVSIDLPGLAGPVVLETLRLFLPSLPLVCLAESVETSAVPAAGPCLSKPFDAADAALQIDAALSAPRILLVGAAVSAEALARAKASFALSGNLLDAAREIARGLPGGWDESP